MCLAHRIRVALITLFYFAKINPLALTAAKENMDIQAVLRKIFFSKVRKTTSFRLTEMHGTLRQQTLPKTPL